MSDIVSEAWWIVDKSWISGSYISGTLQEVVRPLRDDFTIIQQDPGLVRGAIESQEIQACSVGAMQMARVFVNGSLDPKVLGRKYLYNDPYYDAAILCLKAAIYYKDRHSKEMQQEIKSITADWREVYRRKAREEWIINHPGESYPGLRRFRPPKTPPVADIINRIDIETWNDGRLDRIVSDDLMRGVRDKVFDFALHLALAVDKDMGVDVSDYFKEDGR